MSECSDHEKMSVILFMNDDLTAVLVTALKFSFGIYPKGLKNKLMVHVGKDLQTFQHRSRKLMSGRDFRGHLVPAPVPRQEEFYLKCALVVRWFFSLGSFLLFS